jgi:hypothetical protein
MNIIHQLFVNNTINVKTSDFIDFITKIILQTLENIDAKKYTYNIPDTCKS